MNKTHYSSLSTKLSQWNYKLNSIGKYNATIKTMIMNNHQKSKKSNRALNTIHYDYLKSKLSQLHLFDSKRRLFYTSPELSASSYKDVLRYNKPFIENFESSISKALTCHNDPTHRRESSSQFLQKTKAMTKCMKIKEFQKEKLREETERTDSQFQEINSQIYQLNQSSKLLSQFAISQHHYIKYLYSKIDAEKKDNAALYDYRSDLECAIKQLNIKINKAKNAIQNNKQYKIFLLLIKYKVKSVDQLPLSVLAQYDIAQTKRRESLSKANNNILCNICENKIFAKGDLDTIQSKRQMPRSSCKLKDPNKTEPKQLLINPPIFNSPEESIEHFGQLEDRIARLYMVFNEMTYELQSLSRDRDSNKQFVAKNDKEDLKLITMLSIELQKSKGRHAMLEENYLKEKEALEKFPSIDVLFKKIKKTLLSLPFNIEIDFNLPLFYLYINEKSPFIYISGKRESQAVYAIKTLETVLLYLLSQMKEYKNNIKLSHDLRKVVFILEKNKRYEKSRQNQMFETQRRERINQVIIEKYNKVLFLSKRKSENKTKKKQKKKIADEKVEQENYFNIETLLTY